MVTKTLPETMIGLAVAESFARDSGLSLGHAGQIREGDKWLRLFVLQSADATQVFFKRDPESAGEGQLIASFTPRFSVEYKSGLEALKIELQRKGEWPASQTAIHRA